MSCNNLILIIKQNKIGWIAKVGMRNEFDADISMIKKIV